MYVFVFTVCTPPVQLCISEQAVLSMQGRRTARNVLLGALLGQCISSNNGVWLKWKTNGCSFMWGNEVGSRASVFEVVQQCVCWGWLVGSQWQRVSVGEARPDSAALCTLAGDAGAGRPFPLWSSGSAKSVSGHFRAAISGGFSQDGLPDRSRFHLHHITSAHLCMWRNAAVFCSHRETCL